MYPSNIRKQFEEYLRISLGVSKNTVKFYRSDLGHFTNWFCQRLKASGMFTDSLEEAIPYINNSQALAYKAQMEASSNPIKSINRRLSTLRHFARFLVEIGLISHNFMDEVTNSGVVPAPKRTEPDIAHKFAHYLESQKVSQNTIKNYLSDIRHFMTWLERETI